MAKDLSSVGASATASKSDTGLSGDEQFSGRVSVQRSDNGGFIVNVGYERKRKGTQRDQMMSSYCPDKQLTFDDWDAAEKAIHGLYAAAEDKKA